MRDIALTGLKGSGKDTAAKAFDNTHNRLAFADPVKEVCRIVFGLTDAEMNDPMLKQATLRRWPYMSPRSIMQKVGTECFREHFPGVWIENAKRRREESDKPVVLTDMRFEDEADWARSEGMVMVRVVRPSQGPNTDPHPSETFISEMPVDVEIMNEASSGDEFSEQAHPELYPHL